VRTEVLEARRQRVYIDRDSTCSKCFNKISNSAFARAPDGVVMHYVCYTNMSKKKAAAAAAASSTQ
jgi:hypothetical protein